MEAFQGKVFTTDISGFEAWGDFTSPYFGFIHCLRLSKGGINIPYIHENLELVYEVCAKSYDLSPAVCF